MTARLAAALASGSTALHSFIIEAGHDHVLADALVNYLLENASNVQSEQKAIADAGDRFRTLLASLTLEERVQRALNAIRNGEIVVVIDADTRENEGDLILAAECATAEKVAFIVNHTSGLICVGITHDRCEQLKLTPMVQHNTDNHQTAFTQSVDYNVGTTTGISAADRAATIRALADRKIGAEKFNRPGHMFPLKYRAGGVLTRPGHTEASVDLPLLAGMEPCGAMCEIVKKDGSMSRPNELYEFAAKHGLMLIKIEDLIEYRKKFDTKYKDFGLPKNARATMNEFARYAPVRQ